MNVNKALEQVVIDEFVDGSSDVGSVNISNKITITSTTDRVTVVLTSEGIVITVGDQIVYES